jgi:hypothetical protein
MDAAVKIRRQSSRWAQADVSRTRSSLWLRLTVPIAGLAILGSIVGLLFEDAIYGRETADWAAQAVGQDIANLLAFPTMLVAAWFATRGSIRAYLIWIGLLVYSVYTYAIYSFALHFGPLFLAWVAIFGLSVYALVGALATLDVLRIRATFTSQVGVRFAGRLLIVIGCVFALLWLSEIVPAMIANTPSDALKEVGLLTNPVHVLDLALLLPALVVTGAMLLKGRLLGYLLAPVTLVATFFLALGIISLMLVSAARGLESALAVGIGVGVLAIVEAIACMRLLRCVDAGTSLTDVVRRIS